MKLELTILSKKIQYRVILSIRTIQYNIQYNVMVQQMRHNLLDVLLKII